MASIYDGRLWWSAIGDVRAWTNDTNDSSSAQYVDVGYKDQGNTVAVDFLSKAIIVYKEFGKAYQVIGNPHDKTLAVFPLSQTAYCSGSAINVDDKSYYLGNTGFMAFNPTNTYANIQPFEVGLNINSWLAKEVTDTCKMWHIPNRKQIWIKPSNGSDIFLYHYIPRYPDGRGAFTSRTTVYDVKEVVSNGKDTYIAYGDKIGVLDPTTDKDDGQQIQTSIISGNRLATKMFIIMMSYVLVSHNIIEGYGTIGISNKKEKYIDFIGKGTKLYYDTRYLNEATELMYIDDFTKVYKIGGGANRNIQFKIFVSKGAISLRQLDYFYEEV